MAFCPLEHQVGFPMTIDSSFYIFQIFLSHLTVSSADVDIIHVGISDVDFIHVGIAIFRRHLPTMFVNFDVQSSVTLCTTLSSDNGWNNLHLPLHWALRSVKDSALVGSEGTRPVQWLRSKTESLLVALKFHVTCEHPFALKPNTKLVCLLTPQQHSSLCTIS